MICCIMQHYMLSSRRCVFPCVFPCPSEKRLEVISRLCEERSWTFMLGNLCINLWILVIVAGHLIFYEWTVLQFLWHFAWNSTHGIVIMPKVDKVANGTSDYSLVCMLYRLLWRCEIHTYKHMHIFHAVWMHCVGCFWKEMISSLSIKFKLPAFLHQ